MTTAPTRQLPRPKLRRGVHAPMSTALAALPNAKRCFHEVNCTRVSCISSALFSTSWPYTRLHSSHTTNRSQLAKPAKLKFCNHQNASAAPVNCRCIGSGHAANKSGCICCAGEPSALPCARIARSNRSREGGFVFCRAFVGLPAVSRDDLQHSLAPASPTELGLCDCRM